MKKIIVLLCLMTGFAACNSKTDQSGSPTAAIDAMFTGMKNGKLEDIKKFVTKKDVESIEALEKLAGAVDPAAIEKLKTKMGDEFKSKVQDVKYSFKNEKVDGDKATVDAEVTEDGKVNTHTFNLLKEDGAWKISLLNSGDGMFNSAKGNLGRDSKDAERDLEKLKKMNPDSLRAFMKKGMEAMDSMMKEH